MWRLWPLILCVMVMSCYQVKRDCKAYKKGEFQFSYSLDGEEKTARFVRTDQFSIDYYDNTIDSSSIRWINDCEFILKKLHPKRLADKDAVHFKILTTTDSSYTFEYKLAVKKANRSARVERGTAYKIH